jgi:hypothetical protein
LTLLSPSDDSTLQTGIAETDLCGTIIDFNSAKVTVISGRS